MKRSLSGPFIFCGERRSSRKRRLVVSSTRARVRSPGLHDAMAPDAARRRAMDGAAPSDLTLQLGVLPDTSEILANAGPFGTQVGFGAVAGYSPAWPCALEPPASRSPAPASSRCRAFSTRATSRSTGRRSSASCRTRCVTSRARFRGGFAEGDGPDGGCDVRPSRRRSFPRCGVRRGRRARASCRDGHTVDARPDAGVSHLYQVSDVPRPSLRALAVFAGAGAARWRRRESALAAMEDSRDAAFGRLAATPRGARLCATRTVFGNCGSWREAKPSWFSRDGNDRKAAAAKLDAVRAKDERSSRRRSERCVAMTFV